jgi:hypothetical protein
MFIENATASVQVSKIIPILQSSYVYLMII